MKLQLENQDGIYTVETTAEYITLDDYITYLIVPVLQAAGFPEKLLKEQFNGDF